MAWNNPFQEVANSKPLFLTIYGTVIIGIIVSSFYVFSAIYSPDSTTVWQFSPPASGLYPLPACFLYVFLYCVSIHVYMCVYNTVEPR